MAVVEQRRVSALEEHIAALDHGPWFRRREVAALIGVTASAVAAAVARHPELARSRMAVRWRGQVIRVYDRADLDSLRAYFTRQGRGAGRPRIWTAAEEAERRRTRDSIRHHTARAERLARSDPQESHKSASRARELQQQLDAQLDRRKASRVAPG